MAAFARIGFCSLMSKTFRPWTIDQPLLLPPSVQDFVGEDHLARFIWGASGLSETSGCGN